MTATLIDGVEIGRKVRAEWKLRAERLKAAGVIPGLAVIMVGADPASEVYVRNKVKACHEIGIHSEEHRLPDSATTDAVLRKIEELTADPAIHGILVQLPLPGQIDAAIALHRLIVAESARFPALAAVVTEQGGAQDAIRLVAGGAGARSACRKSHAGRPRLRRAAIPAHGHLVAAAPGDEPGNADDARRTREVGTQCRQPVPEQLPRMAAGQTVTT